MRETQQKSKELIIEILRNRGFRITNQRMLLLEVILENDCSCCKEIYYQAKQQDSSIGIATVYRMLTTLEEIGIIDRKSIYQIAHHTIHQIASNEEEAV